MQGSRHCSRDSDSDFPLHTHTQHGSDSQFAMQRAIPSPDDIEDLLLSCRYGDLDDVNSFIDRFGTAPLGDARDENGNTILHMASANNHIRE